MRRSLVTGGSGDIGSAICRRLARDGLHVVVHAYRHPDRAAAVVKDITLSGGSSEMIVFDVRDDEATRVGLERVLEDGPIQVAVNNAAIHADAPMVGMTTEQWEAVIDVGLNGFFRVMQPLLLPMLRKRWGRIIAISSITGLLGNRGQTNYAAAKAGLHGAVKALALEVASRGVTVNAVAPGIIAGGMSGSSFDRDTIKRLVPMRRAGQPEEIAALVAFLASDEAAYVTGQVIGLSGGLA
jgi:3-oxoacyl-[acyl-carrier protein] reductase